MSHAVDVRALVDRNNLQLYFVCMRHSYLCMRMRRPSKRDIQSVPMHEHDAWLCKPGTLHRPEMEPHAIDLHSHMPIPDALALLVG